MRYGVEICVIFARYGGFLEEQAAALRRQNDPRFSVLYVPDAALTPGEFARLDLDARFRVVPSGAATIPVKRNFCLENLRPETKWVVFLDDDAWPPPAWMDALKESFREHPDRLVVGGPTLIPPDARLLERAAGLAFESCIGLGRAARWSRVAAAPRRVPELRMCNLAVRRRCFVEPGARFDESLPISEDMEWCRRVSREQGVSIWIIPDLWVYSHVRPLFRPAFQQFFRYASYRMKSALSGKLRDLPNALLAAPPVGLLGALALAPFLRVAAAAVALYFGSIVLEGILLQKDAEDQALRLISIPFVHLSYAFGALARLLRLRAADTGTYKRPEEFASLEVGAAKK